MDNVSIAWAIGVMSLMGAFITVLVTMALARLNNISKQLENVAAKLDEKVTVTDCKEDRNHMESVLKAAFTQTFQRLDEKIITNDKKFCVHYHNSEGDLSFKHGSGSWGSGI